MGAMIRFSESGSQDLSNEVDAASASEAGYVTGYSKENLLIACKQQRDLN